MREAAPSLRSSCRTPAKGQKRPFSAVPCTIKIARVNPKTDQCNMHNSKIPNMTSRSKPVVKRQVGQIYAEHQQQIYRQTDRMFAVLMLVQWIAGIVAALVGLPRT